DPSRGDDLDHDARLRRRTLRERQRDLEDALLVRRLRVLDIDVGAERDLPAEGPVVELHLLVRLAVARRPLALAGHVERSLGDEDVDVRRLDSRQLDHDRDRLLGAVAVDVRAKPGAEAREPRYLPEIGEEL